MMFLRLERKLGNGMDVVFRKAEITTGGGAVALMVDLLSWYPALPKHAPPASYRSDNGVRVWGYGQAMQALREMWRSRDATPTSWHYTPSG